MTDLWAAIAIAMIFEGMMPFLSPLSWKRMIIKIAKLSDVSLRRLGFIIMLCGVILLSLVR